MKKAQEDKTTCKDMVRDSYKNTMGNITVLWNLYKKDPEASEENLGTWGEYGLSFDYVPKGTFSDQKRGFFRYQICWGGPGTEFRIYADESLDIDKIEYWYLDWFDGAKVPVTGKALDTWREIWEDFREMELPEAKMREAKE
ncbi:MAG: hypothetical protein EHM49_05280 [Deltaproteobacteria bacterium]|nr:MAG: hypothetical protein EHM49_05280 [Deltaproteobacteria bacterium]